MVKKKETALHPIQDVTAPEKTDAEMLISRAIDKNVPVETMQKLLDMRRELKAEQAKEAYDHAMAAFQAACPTIEKTKEVRTNDGKLAYKYAPIESIVAQVKEALRENGFSYSTNMELLESGVRVVIKVTHTQGHSEMTEMTVPLGTKTNIMSQTQVVAAAQTFAKRYAFCNALGILTGDEDTDAAPPPQQAQQAIKPAATQSGVRATQKQLNYIKGLLAQKGKTADDLDAYCERNFNKTPDEIDPAQASKTIEDLQKLPNVGEAPKKALDMYNGENVQDVDPNDIPENLGGSE